MGILEAVIQALVLSMFNAWNQFFLSRTVAFEFVGHDDSWRKARRFE